MTIGPHQEGAIGADPAHFGPGSRGVENLAATFTNQHRAEPKPSFGGHAGYFAATSAIAGTNPPDCRYQSRAYTPFLASNAACDPASTIRPSVSSGVM